mgnify:CR=1 FL=1
MRAKGIMIKPSVSKLNKLCLYLLTQIVFMKTTALFLFLLSCFCGNAQTPLLFLDYPLDPPGVIQNDDPKNFFIFNGRMYFSASDYNHGDELWSTDGTPLGTIKVKEINDNGTTAGSSPAGFTEVNGKFIFSAFDSNGRELWISDGTTTGTHLLKDIFPGSPHANPNYFTKLGNKVVFAARGGAEHTELWITDGTATGTQLLKDIRPGSSSSNLGSFTPFNGKVYFYAHDGTNGTELWETDGTATGTKMTADIYPGPNSSNPASLTVMSGKLYFYAKNNLYGAELWVTDGTTTGTHIVKDIYPGNKSGMESNSNNPLPEKFAVYNNKLYFSAYDSALGYELWVSDGTDTGTYMLKDINPGAGHSRSVNQYIEYNNKLYFSATDDTHGSELWVTDGTDTGTKMVVDFMPGSSGSVSGYFIVFDKHMYFRGRKSLTDPSDFQLVQSDGTATGTKILAPPTAKWDRPLEGTREFFVYNSALYFSAGYDDHGEELWSLRDPNSISVQEPVTDISLFNIYPNPNNGVFTIAGSDENFAGSSINIYDMNGKKIYETIAMSQKVMVNMSAVIPGMYTLIVSMKDGFTTKMVIRL